MLGMPPAHDVPRYDIMPTYGKEGIWRKASKKGLEQGHLWDVQAVPCYISHGAQHILQLWRQLVMPCWQGSCRWQ